MSAVLFPLVWAVVLTGQLAWWSRLRRPGALDGLTRRKLVALRGTLESPDPWVVALVTGAILVPVGAVLLIQTEPVGLAYLAIGAALLAEAFATRTVAGRMLVALGDRGALVLRPAVVRGERSRRRSGLAALLGIALAILPFRAYEESDAVVPLVGGLIVSSIGMLVFFIAVVPYVVATHRLYEARRLADQNDGREPHR